MKTSKMIILSFLAAAIGLSACGQKKSDDGTQVQQARDARTGEGIPQVPSGNVNGSTEGYIFGDNAATFNQNIKVLVSATVDPQDVGNVDHRTGVILKGRIPLNGNMMIAKDSAIELVITDDKKDENGQTYEPIVIRVKGSGGSVNGQSINMNFADGYGTISLTGTYNQTHFDGVLNFKNNTAYQGRSSGTLGRFQIPLCAMFVCQ